MRSQAVRVSQATASGGSPRPHAVHPGLVVAVALVSTAIWLLFVLDGSRQARLNARFGVDREGGTRVTGVLRVPELRVGDRLVRLDGVPVGRRGALNAGEIDGLEVVRRTTFGPQAGDVRLEAVRGDRAANVTAVTLRRRPALSTRGLLLSLALFGTHLLVAVVLAMARTDDPAPRHLLVLLPVLGLTLSVYAVAQPAPPIDLLSHLTFVAGVGTTVAQPGLILSFLTVFPSVTRWRRAVPLLLAVFSLLPAAVTAARCLSAGAATFYADRPLLNTLNALIVGANLAALGRLVVSVRASGDERTRARARLVVLPTAAYLLVLIALQIPQALGRGGPVPATLMYLLPLVFPVSLAAAVSRRHLFQIDRLVRKSAGYFFASAILLILFLLSAPAAAALAARLVPERLIAGPAATGLLAAMGLLLLNPLRTRAQAALDRLFYRGHEDPARLVADLLGHGGGEKPWAEEVGVVLRRIDAALHPDGQRIWTLGEGESGAAPWTQALGVQALAVEERTLRASIEELSGPGPAVGGFLGPSAAVAVPLVSTTGEPLGLWTLGEKKSEEPYTDGELEALSAVARGLSLLLESRRLSSRVDQERLGHRNVLARLARAGGGFFAECPRCGRCFDEETVCPGDGSLAELTRSFPRTLAGRYRLLQRIGTGGMGTVYRANDETLGREVAAKVIQEEHLQETNLARFRREARLAARLSHPNAVAVFDFGELPGGGAYLVMELLAGRTLADELTGRKSLPFREGAAILDQVLQALGAAHALGLVHRDVKPANVFLVGCAGDAPHVKLLDFGLARDVVPGAEGPSLTKTDFIVGTPGYIAPEAVGGEAVTPAADLWAAAVTAYEAFAGKPAFRGRTFLQLFEEARAGRVVPLTSVAPDVPGAYAAVLHAALSPDPSCRPASAARMRAALALAMT